MALCADGDDDCPHARMEGPRCEASHCARRTTMRSQPYSSSALPSAPPPPPPTPLVHPRGDAQDVAPGERLLTITGPAPAVSVAVNTVVAKLVAN